MSAFAGEHSSGPLCHKKAHTKGESMCRQRTHDVIYAVDSNPRKELSRRVR